MSFAVQVAGDLILIGIVLLWARWSKLDLGLRSPILRNAWPWILFFIAWCVVESVIAISVLVPHELGDIGSDPIERLEHLSLIEDLALTVLVAPLLEELLFRGAMFSALMRRWGIVSAAVWPSLLWGLIHVQYEWWFVASVAGSGVVLAIIRWKSGSLYVPLALHAAYNLSVTLEAQLWAANA